MAHVCFFVKEIQEKYDAQGRIAMRKYSLFCNMCGKEIKMEKNVAREGVLAVEHTWGYFSEKDGEIHSFDLCEQCYDHLTAQFKIPPAIKKQTEYL